MRVRALLCSAAAVCACFALPATAYATDVHCASTDGTDITHIDGRTACRAVTDAAGRAGAAGYDGVGYASATAGATALGIGIAGGAGASEGAGGVPIAIGIGADALALTSISAPRATVVPPRDTAAAGPETEPSADGQQMRSPGSTLAVTIALNGSRAQVSSAGNLVDCFGTAALAWDATNGRGCLATPFGQWRTGESALP